MPGEAVFVRALQALTPYLVDLVVVGAWAHRLFEEHPLSRRRDFEPLMTGDADFAVPKLLGDHGPPIDELLKANGFREELSGSDPVPFSEYVADDGGAPFPIEFITPLIGGRTARKGYSKNVARISGVTATYIRYADLLLWEPSEVDLKRLESSVGRAPLKVRTANPVSYLAQKVLSLPTREPVEKRPKDVLYIHDALQLFADHLPELRSQGHRLIESQLHSTTRASFQRLRVDLFSSSRCAEAAAIAKHSGRPDAPSATQIQQACRVGLGTLFGN